MKLFLNGQPREVEQIATVAELLGCFSIKPESIVVERNEQVVPVKQLATTEVKEGDRIEIVQFVGGGSGEEEGNGKPPAKKKARKKARKKATKKTTRRASSKRTKSLVIVESPAKARTINKFLGSDYVVEASMGHVRDLPKSKMGVDVEKDFEPHYITISRARKTVTQLKKHAKGKAHIFLAPDPDREGEAISWHLAHIFTEAKDIDAVIHRVTFNEITKDAVQAAFEHPREIAMNLVDAQQARRVLDRIVGYELSPLLWKKVGRGLSAGRVQSVSLRMIVEREEEIRKFVPQEYWSLDAKLSSEAPENENKVFTAKLDKIGEEKAELKAGDQTEAIRKEIENAPFEVSKIDKRERKRRPQAPYTTSKLQQEAYNRLGFPAAKTMRIAQRLYEGVDLGDEGSVGLITYMRTDSVNVAVSAQQEAVEYIREKFGEDYLPKKPPVYKSKKRAQEAHEAVRSTSVRREPAMLRSYLDEDEFKLYDLIWKKFVSSQMTPAVDEHINVSILSGEKYFFKTTGRRNLFAGFTVVLNDVRPPKASDDKEDAEEASSADLPAFTVGEILKLHELLGNQHFTKPPGRFNDASLVKSLEEEGIGRPSTYAPTIYTLLSRDYIHREGGALVPNELGETVVKLLVEHFPRIMEIEFTANMEEELDKIEEGEVEWVNVLKSFYGPFQTNVLAARELMKNFKQEPEPTDHVCDVCGKQMVIRMGRFGKFLACSGFPDCKYTRSIPTGFLCPNEGCGGDLVKRRSRARRTFYGCSNYPKCTYITNKLPEKKPGENPDAVTPAAANPAAETPAAETPAAGNPGPQDSAEGTTASSNGGDES